MTIEERIEGKGQLTERIVDVAIEAEKQAEKAGNIIKRMAGAEALIANRQDGLWRIYTAMGVLQSHGQVMDDDEAMIWLKEDE